MNTQAIVFYRGYTMLALMMINAPLFVYSIFEYKKHPLFSRFITRRNRVKMTILLGLARISVAMFLAARFVEIVSMVEIDMEQLLLDTLLMTAMAIPSFYVTVIVPIRESVSESRRRAEYLAKKRKEHRKDYLRYKNSERGEE